jgi:hypothetical protein
MDWDCESRTKMQRGVVFKGGLASKPERFKTRGEWVYDHKKNTRKKFPLGVFLWVSLVIYCAVVEFVS